VLRACLEKRQLGGWGSQDERHALTLNLCYCAGEMYVLLCKPGYCATVRCANVLLCRQQRGAAGTGELRAEASQLVREGK